MKNVKSNRLIKVLQIFFAIMLLTSVILIVTACKCSHEYTEEITKPATCSSTGEITYTCSKCGEFYTEVIAISDGHTLSDKYLSDDNAHWQMCENCDYATERITHTYSYQEQGDSHWQQCDVCGFSTDKVKHEFTIQGVVKPSTCTSQGSSTEGCVCGATNTDTLPLADHNFTNYQKEGNLHWQKCENCNATTEKVEHKFTVQGATVPSTCTQAGSDTKTCVCGETHIETLPLAQHSYTKLMCNDSEHWFVCADCGVENANQARTPHDLKIDTTDPDCENDGKTILTCSGCNYVKNETLPKLGHDWDKTTFNKKTNSGHYYKRTRCSNDIVEQHTLVACECPYGNQREATCYRAGHQDERCSICNWLSEFSTPITNEHNYSSELEHNGTVHWYPCINGNGACSAHGSETAHTWHEVVVEPTCTDNGSSKRQCECGEVQSGSIKTLTKLGHDYQAVETLKEPSCDVNEGAGLELKRCMRCQDEKEFVINRLDHVMEGYQATMDGHYRQCINCGFTQGTIRNHDWIDEVKSEATCTKNGLTVHTCKVCKFTYDQVTTKNHSYVTVPDSYVDSTCKDYGTHVGICSECGDEQTFVDEYLGYANHNVKEYSSKEMTETEPGNRHYWQCTVCGKYFTSSGCVEELTEDQVFTYPPKIVEVENIAQLITIAETLDDNIVSDDYYQITTVVCVTDAEKKQLLIGNNDESIVATLIARENVSTINENDVIVLKGNLMKVGTDVTFVNCKVISVDCGNADKRSLFFSVIEDSPYIEIYAYACDDEGVYYNINTNNYNCLTIGSKLTICYFDIGEQNAVLQKVIINGKAYTATNGEFEITVTEDIHAEFIFDHNNYCSVTLRDVDTSNNHSNAIIVDEYISYTYTNGGYNDDGRLQKDSHLTFTANNANITGINITYDADWLADNPNQLDNIINAIKANGGKVAFDQDDYKNPQTQKVVISLSANDGYTAIEYFANVCQARVVEITVLYQTNNTFGTY